MGFWKSLFGGEELSAEEEKKNAEERNFDLLKYDGVKAMRIGQFDYAVKCFRAALEVRDDMETHDYLQQALTRLGQLDEAIAEVKIIAACEPEKMEPLLQMAHLAYLNEDYQLMLEACQQAEKLDNNNGNVNKLMGQAYLGLNDAINGLARLTKAIALDEEQLDARLLRGQTLLKMGQLEGAREDVEFLTTHCAPQEDILLLKARLAHACQQDEEAIAAYGEVIDVNPFCVDAFRERGKIRFDKGDHQGAEEDMQKVMELNPNEMADVSGDYSAEGIEHRVKQAYSNMNPFGI